MNSTTKNNSHNYRTIVLHTIVGVLLGYLILHPISMIIYWFEFEYDASFPTPADIYAVLTLRFNHSFHLQMSPMGILFSILGGLFGFISGRSVVKTKKNFEINHMNQQLIHLEEIKSKFLQLISHEIRTPLNGIVGSVHLLKEMKAPEEFNQVVDILDQSVTRLLGFSVTALRITALQTNKYAVLNQKIDLQQEINQIVDSHNSMIHEKGILLVTNQVTNPVMILGDVELVKICLTEILKNAIEYCDKNIEVTVYDNKEEGYISLGIVDDGPGFSGAILEDLFQLFSTPEFRADNSPGMTFPLLKLIMEAHNGSVQVSNDRTRGANVQLNFPHIAVVN